MSKHFAAGYANRTFKNRISSLIEKTSTGMLRVELVKDSDTGNTIGYCISSVSQEKVGEVESIYVLSHYRDLGIGNCLMQRALKWMDNQNTEKKVLCVAAGNEQVFSFYCRYGFYPRTITLEQVSMQDMMFGGKQDE